jgi:DNA-binding SARP family transcriptional activator
VTGLEVLLFGGFQLRRQGEPLPPIPSRAARSLFAYLVVNRDAHHPRERLAAQFWPELPAARARRRLSHTLWQIQDALGEVADGLDHLEVASDTLSIRRDAPYRVDVEEFEAGLARLRARRSEGRPRARDLADLETVVDLYRGDFLAGHYDGWVTDEQQRLEQRYLEALTWLVELARAQGAYDDALTYARRLTNQDPLREDAHREVMRLSTLLGRTSDALRQYERCREVLADELGTVPSSATQQLHQRVLRQRQRGEAVVAHPTPQPFPDRVPLLGRADERTDVVGVLERTLAGDGGVAFVEGEAGAGKSRFLAELLDDAAWRGFTTLHATCRGPEPAGPYTVVRELLAPALTTLRVAQLLPRISPVWLGLVAQVVPSIRAELPVEHRAPPAVRRDEGAQRLRHALVATFAALADLDPLVLVVDDLQWADDASLQVLEAFAADSRDRRSAVLFGYRGDDARARPAVWDMVRAVDQRIHVVRVRLGPLDAFSIAELVRTLGRSRDLDPAIATRLHRETGGNPLFVVETLRALAQDGHTLTDEVAELPLPGSIRDLVRSRVASLSCETRTVLDVGAVIGAGTDLVTLEAAAELPRTVVVDALDLLLRRGLLRERDDGFALHHDQIRRIVLDDLPAPAARALHQRVGEALEVHHPGAIERLAHHFGESGDTRRAVTYLRQAAEEAMAVHANAAADRYLRRAIDHQRSRPASVAARFDLLAEHESVLDVLGDRDRQRQTVEELVSLAASDDRRAAEALRRQALLDAQTGDLPAAETAARRALELVSDTDGTDRQAVGLLTLARILAWSGQRQDAIPVFLRALRGTERAPALEIELRTTLASVLRELQRYDEAATELTAALRLAGTHGELREEAHALGVLGTVRMETGRSAEATELYGQAIARCRSIGFRRGEGINLVNQANVLYSRGEVGEALAAYADAAAVFGQLEDRRGEAAVRLNLGFVCHAILGDDDRGRRELEVALTHFEAIGDVHFEAACLDALASVALRAGDLTGAEARLERALALPGITGHAWTVSQLLERRAEVLLAAGDADAAQPVLTEALELVRAHRLADLEAGLLALDGTARLAAGDVAGAVTATDAAVAAIHDGVERRFLVHLRHHEALAAAGDVQRAAEAARRAVAELTAILDGLGAEDRAKAEAVPEHRRILQATPAGSSTVTEVRVASASAPRGRPLRTAELLDVVVDLDPGPDAPADPIRRRRHVLHRVIDQVDEQGGAVTVTDLAHLLAVSEATVRRDLQALRRSGARIETRGRRSG